MISHLATTLPGIRLGEKLNACGANSHQQIADVLGADGMSLMYHASNVVVLTIVPGKLTHRTLDILRTSEIAYLDLSSSMGDQDGLNLDAQALLHGTVDALRICSPHTLSVFSKANSFLFLAEVNLAGSQLNESDLLHLAHLPRLARLWLTDTGITNEAYAHTVICLPVD